MRSTKLLSVALVTIMALTVLSAAGVVRAQVIETPTLSVTATQVDPATNEPELVDTINHAQLGEAVTVHITVANLPLQYPLDWGVHLGLEGTISELPDGSQAYLSPYWFGYGPDGSTSEKTFVTTFTPDVAGLYQVHLSGNLVIIKRNPEDPEGPPLHVGTFGLGADYSIDTDAANTAPTIDTFTVTSTTVAINTPVTATAAFTDPDTLDSHTATFDWGDGSTPTAGTASGSSTMIGTHTYTATSTYTITCTVSDGTTTSAPKIATVKVISPTTVADGVQTFGGTLTTSNFNTAQNYKAYVNKLNALAKTIEAGNYADAQAKITNDLIKRNTQWGTDPVALNEELQSIYNELIVLQNG